MEINQLKSSKTPRLINVQRWIAENLANFRPPICNKMMHDEQLKVFFVGGPNQRQDYHVELGEEFFYQIKGDMCLETIEKGRKRSVVIREGHCFLLPARIPHSPQRFADTMGMVIERRRDPQELDGLRYYVNDNHIEDGILYERFFHCQHLGTQLGPMIAQYLNSNEYRTGRPSENSQIITPPYGDDVDTELMEPLNLAKWLNYHHEEIREIGYAKLFGHPNQNQMTRVYVFGGQSSGHNATDDYGHSLRSLLLDDHEELEMFLWQMVGTSKVQLITDNNDDNRGQPKCITLEHDDSLLISSYEWATLHPSAGSYALVVAMPPGRLKRSAA